MPPDNEKTSSMSPTSSAATSSGSRAPSAILGNYWEDILLLKKDIVENKRRKNKEIIRKEEESVKNHVSSHRRAAHDLLTKILELKKITSSNVLSLLTSKYYFQCLDENYTFIQCERRKLYKSEDWVPRNFCAVKSSRYAIRDKFHIHLTPCIPSKDCTQADGRVSKHCIFEEGIIPTYKKFKLNLNHSTEDNTTFAEKNLEKGISLYKSYTVIKNSNIIWHKAQKAFAIALQRYRSYLRRNLDYELIDDQFDINCPCWLLIWPLKIDLENRHIFDYSDFDSIVSYYCENNKLQNNEAEKKFHEQQKTITIANKGVSLDSTFELKNYPKYVKRVKVSYEDKIRWSTRQTEQ